MAEDRAAVRGGVRALLEHERDIRLVGETGHAAAVRASSRSSCLTSWRSTSPWPARRASTSSRSSVGASRKPQWRCSACTQMSPMPWKPSGGAACNLPNPKSDAGALIPAIRVIAAGGRLWGSPFRRRHQGIRAPARGDPDPKHAPHGWVARRRGSPIEESGQGRSSHRGSLRPYGASRGSSRR